MLMPRFKQATTPPPPESESEDDSGDEWIGPELPQQPPKFCQREGCPQEFTNRKPMVLFAECGHTVYCVKCAKALVDAAEAAGEAPKCPICNYEFPDYYEVDFNCRPQSPPPGIGE